MYMYYVATPTTKLSQYRGWSPPQLVVSKYMLSWLPNPFVRKFKTKGKPGKPKVSMPLANQDPAAKKYAEWTRKACQNKGLRYKLCTMADPIDMEVMLMDANDGLCMAFLSAIPFLDKKQKPV